MSMKNQVTIDGRQFATNGESQGVFELIDAAYIQHRGTSQTPTFKTKEQFKSYVERMLGDVHGYHN